MYKTRSQETRGDLSSDVRWSGQEKTRGDYPTRPIEEEIDDTKLNFPYRKGSRERKGKVSKTVGKTLGIRELARPPQQNQNQAGRNRDYSPPN